MKLHYKTPISFVLGILINIVLVVAVEMLLFYRTPLPLDPADLSAMDPRYADCSISPEIQTTDGRVTYYQVKTQDGQTDLVPVRQHSFFFSRVIIYSGKIIANIDLKEDQSFRQFFGLRINTISVSDGHISVSYGGGASQIQAELIRYMLLGAALTFLEQFIWGRIRGNT